MSAIERGLKNPFRNKVRTTVVLLLLSVVIGLFVVMVQAAFQTQEQLENLQVHLRTLIELRGNLRYYESIGLLPSPARTSIGYRVYSSAIWERLDFIQKAQTLGLTLAEIREILAVRDSGTAPCEHIAQQIAEKIRAIAQKIAELQALKSALSDLLTNLRTDQQAWSPEASICPHIQRVESRKRNGYGDHGGER